MTFKVKIEAVEKTRGGYTIAFRKSGDKYGWLRVEVDALDGFISSNQGPFDQEFTVSIEPIPGIPGYDKIEDAAHDAAQEGFIQPTLLDEVAAVALGLDRPS